MISLMSGGMYHSLWDLFTTDELLTTGSFCIMLGYIYIKAHIMLMKDKKIERDFQRLEIERKAKATTDMKNVNVSKLFV